MSAIAEHIEADVSEVAQKLGLRPLNTLAEAEAFLHISHTKMRSLIKSGAIQSVKIGGSRRILAESLVEVVKKGTK